MTVNAEQIGSEGKEEREEEERGEETDGRAGPVPTIPRHDDAGGTPFPSPLPALPFTLVAVRVYVLAGNTSQSERGDSPPNADSLGFFFFFFCICNQLMCDGRRR